LQRLIDRSLVSFESQDGVSRYRMLRTLRQHLLGRPAAADEVDGARHRHLRWLTELAANSTADPFDGHGLALLVAEHANLDAALTWAFASDRAEEGVRLCTMCGPYWFQTGRYADAESWLIKLRAAVPSMTDAALLARAALLLGGLATIAGSDDSTAELRRAHRLARMAGDTRTYARAVHWLGEAYLREGRHRRARLALEAAARHYTEEHDARVGGVYARLALACLGLNDLPAAEAHARSALAMAQTSGQAWALARAWHAIGVLSVARDDLDDALVALNRSHQHACLARTPSVRIDAALALASVYVSRREVSACGGVLLDLLHNVPFRALGAQVGKFERLVQQLLAVAPRGGRGTRAERLTRALSEQWSAARRNGVAPTGDAGGPAEVAPKPLSEREMEVARLIARDLTNRAIAAELTLSEGTVHVHVEHILRKLGLQSRAQVAHWVRQLVS
jgi:DNA-binding CsgD family transcriptional regulator/tetratricopeptide (TPR) repeat protein